MLTLGIDDAGRGPVIGPMTMSGVLINSETEKKFRDLGVRDSKQLTDSRRETLSPIIKEKSLDYEILIVSPEEIDSNIKSGTNLNTIEAMKAAEIINKINKKFSKEKIKVIIDCPSPNLEAWKNTVKSYVTNLGNLDFSVEHKADINHVACSAASVIGKSERERQVSILKKKLGVDFGSGYPSDPVTCKFLKDYNKKYEKSGIFRQTWQTWKQVCEKKEQKKLGEF